MSVPLKQVFKIGSYVMRQKLKGRERYPLVLMLEPLFRCNLECIGCGKIQKPNEILNKNLTLDQCFNAANECNAPVVSIVIPLVPALISIPPALAESSIAPAFVPLVFTIRTSSLPSLSEAATRK